MGKPSTIKEAVTQAATYWETSAKDARMMVLRAWACADIVGRNRELDSLTASDGTLLLTELGRGRGRATVKAYYGAFKRALALAGLSTSLWPKSLPVARRVREPMLLPDVEAMRAWMYRRGWSETGDLITVLLNTGMRVDVEALNFDAWSIRGGTLKITGKGGHERRVPLPESVRVLMEDRSRMLPMMRLSYDGHLKRWRRACSELGICTRLPTPHALRHLYATLAYERLDHNLVHVQHLLGHADVSTTAGYIGVSMDALSKGLEDAG